MRIYIKISCEFLTFLQEHIGKSLRKGINNFYHMLKHMKWDFATCRENIPCLFLSLKSIEKYPQIYFFVIFPWKSIKAFSRG